MPLTRGCEANGGRLDDTARVDIALLSKMSATA